MDLEQCPAAHQTKQVLTETLLHWLQPFVAYCTEMNQSILRLFHLCHIHEVCISAVHEEEYQRPFQDPIWMYLLDLMHTKVLPNHLLLWSTEIHSYGSSWKHVACLTETCVHQDEPKYLYILCVQASWKKHMSMKLDDSYLVKLCRSSYKVFKIAKDHSLGISPLLRDCWNKWANTRPSSTASSLRTLGQVHQVPKPLSDSNLSSFL